MTKRILMAEDEENISDFVSRGLQNFDYEVTVVNNGTDAWSLLRQGSDFNLVILDIRMPGMSGIEVCQRIREHLGYHLPVLMLTALDTTDDIVMGLHAGADEYIAKPFKFMELLAHIQALLRRVELDKDHHQTVCGDLHIDASSHKAIREGKAFDLSVKEFRLLQYLMEHEGEILSRRQLLKDVWDKDFDTNTNVVDVYVRYLRQKIDDGFEHKLIQTVVGTGYCFRRDAEK
ncbi:MAG: response regulator transcription factor [Prevotella sp.]|jgi:DNA-binding response OmpR family regulator|nr:response regulator transcription factor [Prevotella sp.]